VSVLLKADQVWGGYSQAPVVKGVSLEIRRGEFVGLIGPNGSGKSTLLKLMTRVLSPQKGTVSYEGQNIADMALKDLARKTAFVPQDTWVHFPFTVEEVVLMGRVPHLRRLQSETKKDFSIADDALTLTGARHLKGQEIDKLSAGDRQRVIVAKALAQEPELLFLDEPTSHLDIGHQVRLLDMLRDLNREKKLTVLIVLHDLNLAGEYCDRLLLLEDGRLFREGAPREVLTYANIETVYKTVVVVKENPISSKPYVILASGKQLRR